MMKKNLLIILLGVFLLIALSAGCITVNKPPPQSSQPFVEQPIFRIMSKNARDGYEGIDYVLYIDLTIYNSGGSGSKTIWCKLEQNHNFWTKQQSIYLQKGDTQQLTFTFREMSFWDGSGTYTIWIT